MATLNEVLSLMNQLSSSDKEILRNILVQSRDSSTDDIDDYVEKNRFSNGRVCVYCGSVHVVRNGHRKDGTQRYLCRDCNRSFVVNANSVTANTRKDLEVWKKYIDCMMNGLSVRKSAEICGIHRNTAFIWRHKILDALQNMHDSVRLSGIVEADETFFPVSYKGNHSKSSFTMPRESRHRGGQVHKKGLSNEQVCVPCAVNRKGQSISRVGKLGKVNRECIEKAFAVRILAKSVLCTDKEKSYRKYSTEHEIKLIQLDKGEIKKGIYHIQHINNYHSRLKEFIDRFKGVSTKYLNNYLVWNNLVVCAKESYTEKRNIFLEFIMTTQLDEKCRDIPKRLPLPLLV